MKDYMGVLERYSDSHYEQMMRSIDPVETIGGYSVKRCDRFALGIHVGMKVRQCLHVCFENMRLISERHSGGVCTGAGLPSPQIGIVAGVARYFGLKAAVTTPRFQNGKKDYSRISASIAAAEGADVYGVRNPNPSGYERDAKCLAETLGYFQVKFGMAGRVSMEPVSLQCENIPKYVRTVVLIAGSGLSACGVLHGIRRFSRPVLRVVVVCLSKHFHDTRDAWYEPLGASEKFDGEVVTVQSPAKYQSLCRHQFLDWTYESKAWSWMESNITPSRETLFWVIGRKCYDLGVIRDIAWKTSKHEAELELQRSGR
jgi:hypothetical protein